MKTGLFTGMALKPSDPSTYNKSKAQRQSEDETTPLFVFSHLRWHFVTQRPQHLLSRAAQTRPVYFWEEPHWEDHPKGQCPDSFVEVCEVNDTPGVTILRPHFYPGQDAIAGQRRLLNQFMCDLDATLFDAWYYTPMALAFTSHLHPEVTIYDCMDELSAFLGAPPQLIEFEAALFKIADVVFTGGQSIFEAKRHKHANVHSFPSSIDVPHFAQARVPQLEPLDQMNIPHPRAGFFGVIDERFDIQLIAEVARARPEIQFVFIGPVVKIDPAQLPREENIHYLGSKSYKELPAYLFGWDVALLPFALNDSTRFISPTKTPEYLAAGKRVISTPIKDVVESYGKQRLVQIAATAEEFAIALDRDLDSTVDPLWTAQVEKKLAESSWDKTWAAMSAEIEAERSYKTVAEDRMTSQMFPVASAPRSVGSNALPVAS